MGYIIRSLDAADRCNALSLGVAELQPLKSFLKSEAKRLHQENFARTFVFVEEGDTKVLAYITLICTHVAVQGFGPQQPVEEPYRYNDYPAVKIGRLAVDASLQGNGVGSKLVDFAIGLAVEHVMPHAGCRFLVLDAKPTSVSFYTKKGFSRLGPVQDAGLNLTAMFIDLHRL